MVVLVRENSRSWCAGYRRRHQWKINRRVAQLTRIGRTCDKAVMHLLAAGRRGCEGSQADSLTENTFSTMIVFLEKTLSRLTRQ